MLAFILLGVLGAGLVYEIVSDDDDDSSAASNEGERIIGDDDPQLLDAGDGDDTVFANEGEDTILARGGDDRVFGGANMDDIVGGAGDDFLRGGSGDDGLIGGLGADSMFGDSGEDVLLGADLIDGEALAEAQLASDTELTDAELQAFFDFDADTGEADTLNGGIGEDILIAGSNDEVTTGDDADDVLLGTWVTPGQPVEITDFAVSEDVITYAYEGDTAPNVFFDADENGLTTLSITVSGAETAVLATLPGVEFATLSDSNLVLTQLDPGGAFVI